MIRKKNFALQVVKEWMSLTEMYVQSFYGLNIYGKDLLHANVIPEVFSESV